MIFWKKDKNDRHEAENAPTPDPASPSAAADQGQDARGGPDPSGAPEPAGTTAGEPVSEAATPIDATMTEAKVIEAIRTCYDPEIPVNIYELGLIYEVDVQDSGDVAIKMTLTSPMCPVAGTLPHEVEAKVAGVQGVKSAHVDVVWDPPWTPEKMSEAAKLQLGML